MQTIRYRYNKYQMDSTLKLEPKEQMQYLGRISTKKEKAGRWSTAESYLFESLLQRYGKNWKKIHQHMKNRTLSQIRSHAQKLFNKLGTKKVEEYERRSKLLEAYETLQNQKKIKDLGSDSVTSGGIKYENFTKIEEESPATGEELRVLNPLETAQNKSQEIIKEQFNQKNFEIKQEIKHLQSQAYFPFQFTPASNEGYLLTILRPNMEQFLLYQGIQCLIDNPNFNTHFAYSK